LTVQSKFYVSTRRILSSERASGLSILPALIVLQV
jgi:hypothetical protein